MIRIGVPGHRLLFCLLTAHASIVVEMWSGEIGKDVSELPSDIRTVATENKVYLIADFEHRPDYNGIPIYLINLTGQNLQLDEQDSDFYLKLE